MSTPQPILTPNVSGDAYIVAPPRACDAVGTTLCRAFRTADSDLDEFGDLMRKLDSIPSDRR